MNEFLTSVDNTWTLFLDRDGVINRRPMDNYIKSPDEFEFLPGVLEAMKIMNEKFGKIIVVTNQQGIGKKLMTEADLDKVHQKMLLEIEKAGGKIDKVYYCPHLATREGNCRKPGLFMAKQAKTDFPEIDFKKSIMAGDTKSDLDFAAKAGMIPLYINTNHQFINKKLFKAEFRTLYDLAKTLLAND